MRGSHSEYQKQGEYAGSTPACAGKPVVSEAAEIQQGVYPRVCGEAAAELVGKHNDMGLPPRVRGSL